MEIYKHPWLRLIMVVILISVYRSFMMVEDLIGNHLVSGQLEGGDMGYVVWRFYLVMKGYLPIILFLVIVALLWKEIKMIIIWILDFTFN